MSPVSSLVETSVTWIQSDLEAATRMGASMTVPIRQSSQLAQGRLVAGIDLGSTALKMLVADESGRELITRQVATPWTSRAGGTTEMLEGHLRSAVQQLLHEVSDSLARVTDEPVQAIAVSGMGETGVLIDRRGRVMAPPIAWFDPRGAHQVREFPAAVRTQFAGRTGLPLGAQTTVAKLAWLRDQGIRLDGLRWLNLPEFVAVSLGGEAVLEHSLTSRTGLIDQDTGHPWPEMLDALGVGDDFLPDRVDAGAPVGLAEHHVPPNLTGATLTVAGHDHLVGAAESDSTSAAHYHVSMGTAEVLLRVIDTPLGYEARTRLADRLINVVRHVLPGRYALVAGVKTGLLLRRVLQLTGIHDRAGRDRLDDALMSLPYEGTLAPGGLEVGGARNDDGDLRLTLRTDGVSPAEIFGAVLRHSNDELADLISVMDQEVPPARTSTLTGGWTGMRSVQRARAQVLPGMTLAAREQGTAHGAARTAARLLTTPTHS